MATEIDTSGLNCPLPVLKARKALKTMAAGEELTVIATDPASSIDFQHFCASTGHELIDWSEDNGVFTYRIKKSG